MQVIPWLLSDSNFVRCSSQRLDPSKTVFVGALHGGVILNFKTLFGNQPPHPPTFGKYLGFFTPSITYFHLPIDQVFSLQKDWLKCLPICLVGLSMPALTLTDSSELVPCLRNGWIFLNLFTDVQVPHWKWSGHLQQCEVLHEGCGCCFH